MLMPFQRIAKNSRQQHARYLPFDYVVLGAFLDGGQTRALVVIAGQHYDGKIGSLPPHVADRVQPGAVG